VLEHAAENSSGRCPFLVGGFIALGLPTFLALGAGYLVVFVLDRGLVGALVTAGLSALAMAILCGLAIHTRNREIDRLVVDGTENERIAARAYIEHHDRESLHALDPVTSSSVRLASERQQQRLMGATPAGPRTIERAYDRHVVRFTSGKRDPSEAYGSQQLRRVLERYGQIWDLQGQWAEAPVPAYRESVRVDHLDDRVGKLLHDVKRVLWRQPLFRRLQFVRQLSTVAHTADLGGTHTRLAHSFGTLDVAAVVLGRINGVMEAPDVEPDLRTAVDDRRLRVAFLVAAGIHDAFHGPLGHSLDAVSELIFPGPKASERKLDRVALNAHLTDLHQRVESNQAQDGDPLLQILTDLVDPEHVPSTLVMLMHILSVPGSRGEPTRYSRATMNVLDLLASLVDGGRSLDIDRLDYLYRDLSYLGDGKGMGPELEDVDDPGTLVNQIIDRATVESRGHTIQFSFRKQDMEMMEQKRQRLYREVYYHETKQGLDAMLQRGFYWFLENENMEEDPLPRRSRLALLQLTDHELFHLLHELSGKHRHRLPWALVRRGLHGAAFKKHFQVDAKAETVRRVVRHANLAERSVTGAEPGFVRAKETTFSEPWFHEVAAMEGVEPKTIAAIVTASALLSQHPKRYAPVERALWRAVLESDPDGPRRFLSAEIGTLESELEDMLHSRPLVFLVPSWEFRLASGPTDTSTGRIPVLRGYAPRQLASIEHVFERTLQGTRPLVCEALERGRLPEPGEGTEPKSLRPDWLQRLRTLRNSPDEKAR